MDVRPTLHSRRRRPAALALAAVGALAALAGAGMGAYAAPPAPGNVLLPHKATYNLTLDGTRNAAMVDDLTGEIAYEITGDACAGYTTITRQRSEGISDTNVTKQEVTSTAWEAGDGRSYRFRTATSSTGDEKDAEIEASVTRGEPDGLRVVVTRTDSRTIDLKGRILLPTEHVRAVLEAAGRGEKTLQARVYDGTSDPGKVFDTLAIIGRPATDDVRVTEPAAKATLAGSTYYPVTVSYFEGQLDRPPSYVMSYTLYDNGVVGTIKIDYGRFAVTGRLASFEPLKPGADCQK